ncbi:MAG: trigger factor [Pseudomonadota bacterium]
MQVSVENTGSLERKVHVEIPGDKITSEISSRLQRLTKTTKIQGFRPGKAPLKVVQSRYGTQVRQEVLGEMLQSGLQDALTQENLKPAGTPRIEAINDEDGKDFAFTAVIEIYPEVVLKPVEQLAIERPVCNISEKDVADMIEVLRKQQRRQEVVERAAKDGDIININFEGFLDGEAFEGGKAENYNLEIGSNSFIEGFESGLIGQSAEDETTLNLTFPEDYNKEEFQGKAVEFKVKVNSVNEPVLPPIDAEFMKAFGVQDGNEDTFKAEIQKNMEREVDLTLRQQVKNTVLDALHADNEVDLPQSMVMQESQRIKEELEQNMKRQGIDSSPIKGADDKLFTEQAEKRVSLQLLVAEIIKKNDIKPEQSRVRSMIEEMATGYEDPNTVINWYYSDKNNLAQVEALVLEEEVINWVLMNAKVTEKARSFDEIMNKRQTDN